MQEQIQEFSFLPFTIILVVLLGILFYYLPETKGIPVNEIEALFQVQKYFFKINWLLLFHVKKLSKCYNYFFKVPNAWKRPIGRSDRILLQEIRTKQGKTNYGSTNDKGHEAI